jgi:hypothetical protein
LTGGTGFCSCARIRLPENSNTQASAAVDSLRFIGVILS